MILRNRDLNVQQKDAAAEQQKRRGSQLGGNAAIKRQAAHLVVNKEELKEQKDEPKPKRTCNPQSSSSILQDFSNTLCINSALRKSIIENEAPKPQSPPPNFEFDQENVKDFTAVTDYVQDIFNYYKNRERLFRVSDYLKKHHMEQPMRIKIVNWLVEMQETFELNHETLYLAVKLFDLFLDRTPTVVPHQELQLIASAAVFIASKYDERSPPLIDDFIYMAEDGFTREQMMAMERELLKVIEFDLGAPLSYRFLRRFARVAKEDMGTLTLARYVLETSLMSLHFSRASESLIAAACLLLAKRMKKSASDWFVDILQKCSGYTMAEIEPLMWELNRMLVQRKQLFGNNDNIFHKYSHEIFFEVANIPPLSEQHHTRSSGRTRSGSRPTSGASHH